MPIGREKRNLKWEMGREGPRKKGREGFRLSSLNAVKMGNPDVDVIPAEAGIQHGVKATFKAVSRYGIALDSRFRGNDRFGDPGKKRM